MIWGGYEKHQQLKFWTYYGEHFNYHGDVAREDAEFQGDFQFYFANVIEQVMFHSTVLAITADIGTYLMLKKLKRVRPKNDAKNHADIRLSIMAVTTHCVQLIPALTADSDAFGDFRKLLSGYILITNYHWISVTAVSQICMSLLVLYFMRPQQQKITEVTTAVLTQEARI
ncbi:unnamed protein product, partial [Mesorhabditis spiculigera]